MTLVNLSSSLAEGTDLTSPNSILDMSEEITELSDSEKLEGAMSHISELKVENEKLRDEVICLKKLVSKLKSNVPEDLENDDNNVKYFTGLSSFVTLMALFNLMKPEISDSKRSSLTPFQKVIITLMRLRLNLSVTDLSYRFGVCATTISKVFLDTINVMYIRLQPLVRWPERDELYETMPMVFRKYFGHKITVIIDCFEVFVDRPSNMTARAQTWSNYKHHNTAKYLIGITPQGTVSFISEGWGGRVSDKHLTANSNFVSKLIHGDVVLADRGFEIQELVAVAGAEVKYPVFMRGKTQLTAAEVESTRKIANVRIHVERVIGCVRQKCTILGGTCPVDYLITKTDSSNPVLDKIVFACCALTNMCSSVVQFD
ncbi:uncharacterized protein LOC121387832 [Gigantopelta aegis]|uniref:uncharacterized protein LOC121387832 n=1 Tax=Gigantopelta aegis TaxID=1735272 RepID=UPI001B88BAFA|nr:uncharacterized protein LOC121387832 [Gigantopelta aegis]